jgi:hypothetical protein
MPVFRGEALSERAIDRNILEQGRYFCKNHQIGDEHG